ncbi:hypothetical protein GCM10009582_14690 [Arthrobacter flavus]
MILFRRKWRALTAPPKYRIEVDATLAESDREYLRAEQQARDSAKQVDKLHEVNIRNGFAHATRNTIIRHQGAGARALSTSAMPQRSSTCFHHSSTGGPPSYLFRSPFLLEDMGVLACWPRHDCRPQSFMIRGGVVTGVGRCRRDR